MAVPSIPPPYSHVIQAGVDAAQAQKEIADQQAAEARRIRAGEVAGRLAMEQTTQRP